MALNIPAALKSADISRFAHRAAQLETAKPVIAYWCDYWIVNQILGKALHNANEECLTYTTALMDKLETFKSENQSNDAVVDDMAGKAYVEQFGLETFQRADNAMRADKATLRTADTFQASSTFLDLLQIWGQIDPEIVSKIKYAKFHALRIAKAVKAGEDPNLSNPKPEPQPEETLPLLDAEDPEVQMLNGGGVKPRQPSVVEIPDEAHRLQRSLAERSSTDESIHPSRSSSLPRPPDSKARQPSVVEVPDESHRLQSLLAPQSSQDESLHPSRTPSAPPPSSGGEVSPITASDPAAFYTNNENAGNISPISAPNDRKSSLGGNYFPQVPSPLGTALPPPELSLPSAPPADSGAAGFTDLGLPVAPSEPSLPQPPTSFTPSLPQPPTSFGGLPPPFPPSPQTHHHAGHFLPSTTSADTIPPGLAPQSQPRQPLPQAPPQIHQQPPHQPPPPLFVPAAASPPAPAPAPVPAPAGLSGNAVLDEEAIMKAQKHARWAISALNFEDVPTAIRELQAALTTLGAR